MKTPETFYDVVKFLSTIENINRGGCGISALAMYLWLEKNGLINYNDSIVYLYDDLYQYNTNQKLVNNVSNFGSACSHAILKHSGFYFDSDGEFFDIKKYSYYQELSVDAVRITLKSNNWNYMFDRNKNLKKIETVLGVNIFNVKSKRISIFKKK